MAVSYLQALVQVAWLPLIRGRCLGQQQEDSVHTDMLCCGSLLRSSAPPAWA